MPDLGAMMRGLVVVLGCLMLAGTVTSPAVAAADAKMTVKVRSADGQPVAGACVHLIEPFRRGAFEESDHYCTGDDGILPYSIPPMTFRMFVVPELGGYGAQWVGFGGGTGDMRKARVFELESGTSRTVYVRLDKGGSIGGRVLSTGGSPVSGLCPYVAPPAPDPREIHGVRCTDTEGRYRITNLGPYAWPVHFADYTRRFAWTWSGGASNRFDATQVSVRSGRTAWASVRLPKGGEVRGGAPEAAFLWNDPHNRVMVQAVNAVTRDFAAPTAVFLDEGKYRLFSLATQKINIRYIREPGGTYVWYPDPVTVTAGEIRYRELR